MHACVLTSSGEQAAAATAAGITPATTLLGVKPKSILFESNAGLIPTFLKAQVPICPTALRNDPLLHP
jgi:hypothetical protein